MLHFLGSALCNYDEKRIYVYLYYEEKGKMYPINRTDDAYFSLGVYLLSPSFPHIKALIKQKRLNDFVVQPKKQSTKMYVTYVAGMTHIDFINFLNKHSRFFNIKRTKINEIIGKWIIEDL